MELFTSPFILLITGLVIVLLGIGAGMLISSLGDEGEPEEESADQAPPGGRKGRYQPVARLWRERESGRLIVEIEGKSFVGAEAMSANQRSAVEGAARDLRAWLGMGLNTPVAPQQATPTVNAPSRAQSTQAVAAAPAAPLYTNNPVPYSTPAAVTAPGAAAVNGTEEAAAAVVGQKSIVMQIEDILQDMLAGSSLASKGIHLIEDPTKGVIVRIGLSHYEGIEAVPDPEIKATIRAAVAEWEKTQ